MFRPATTPVSWSIRSASVDLPWSMCAMMQKLRITAGSVRPGSVRSVSAEPVVGDTGIRLGESTFCRSGFSWPGGVVRRPGFRAAAGGTRVPVVAGQYNRPPLPYGSAPGSWTGRGERG